MSDCLGKAVQGPPVQFGLDGIPLGFQGVAGAKRPLIGLVHPVQLLLRLKQLSVGAQEEILGKSRKNPIIFLPGNGFKQLLLCGVRNIELS